MAPSDITAQTFHHGMGTTGPAPASPSHRAADREIKCFAPGTLITTLKGKRAVEELEPGEMILTRDRGFQPLLWRGTREVRLSGSAETDHQRPVHIQPGALGPGQPERDLILSANHRVLGRAAQANGETEVLIEAGDLVGRPGIAFLEADTVTYHHLLLEAHEVILAENSWVESFQMSTAAAAALVHDGDAQIAGRAADASGGPAGAGLQRPARLCAAE